MPDMQSLQDLNPFRHMTASARIKLREDTRPHRSCITYHFQLCNIYLGEANGEINEEWLVHFNALKICLEQIRALFYWANSSYSWAPKVSNQPFFEGQELTVAIPKHMMLFYQRAQQQDAQKKGSQQQDTQQEQGQPLVHLPKLHDFPYESNWDAISWTIGLEQPTVTLYLAPQGNTPTLDEAWLHWHAVFANHTDPEQAM